MSNDFNSKSRSGYRAKRKKTNLVLNSLIIIVLLLIIFVAYTIFLSGGDEKAAPKQQDPKMEQKDTTHKADTEKKKDEVVQKDDSSSKNDSEEEQESEEASVPESTDDSQAVVSEDGTTIENPAWKPVGTTQTGDHTPVYSGVDWDEMLSAISYATGVDTSNMTVIWLGKDPAKANASVGTISAKDTKEKFKVFIEWVDGQGWKPTKVINVTGE
ncbi:YrrS family protein [Neobacillus sp. MM2021_6]|uniref:YrrS family protein n=1 Tax=Bacillaceae TaxID=186817 RepID=UPI00140CBAE3|nr:MULTISPECIES: YrrS family protein [Bacillaceae]MBO0959408.1 YrrS family protein [Neobacillus sp. MM2021_6]NHC17294.1 DUF1510 family protein [Bacillus sp. MM2020_4]WML40648.1 YrrS family protein [Neobacillus sp. OS1-2]